MHRDLILQRCTEKERIWNHCKGAIRGTLPPLCTGSHWLSWEPAEEAKQLLTERLQISSCCCCCSLRSAECLLKLRFRRRLNKCLIAEMQQQKAPD